MPAKLKDIEAGSSSRKDRNVSVDLNPKQKERLQVLAERSGMSLSEYLRGLVSIAIQRDSVVQANYSYAEAMVGNGN